MTSRPDVAGAAEDAPVAAMAAVAANPATTGTRLGAKQQLLAACRAAQHWLQAERDRTGETRPDEILRVLRATIERAEAQVNRASCASHVNPGRVRARAARKQW